MMQEAGKKTVQEVQEHTLLHKGNRYSSST